jgi:hypothetical protein
MITVSRSGGRDVVIASVIAPADPHVKEAAPYRR